MSDYQDLLSSANFLESFLAAHKEKRSVIPSMTPTSRPEWILVDLDRCMKSIYKNTDIHVYVEALNYFIIYVFLITL